MSRTRAERLVNWICWLHLEGSLTCTKNPSSFLVKCNFLCIVQCGELSHIKNAESFSSAVTERELLIVHCVAWVHSLICETETITDHRLVGGSAWHGGGTGPMAPFTADGQE